MIHDTALIPQTGAPHSTYRTMPCQKIKLVRLEGTGNIGRRKKIYFTSDLRAQKIMSGLADERDRERIYAL